MLSATIEEGFQAIVKTLYSISVSKTHATASEVATVLSPYGRRDLPCVKLKLELNMLVPVFLLNAVVVPSESVSQEFLLCPGPNCLIPIYLWFERFA